MRCAVCSTDGAKEMSTHGDERVGFFCVGECQGLGWEAFFVTKTNGDEFEHALILWRWRRRRAEVDGRTFLEPAPKSLPEMDLERWAAGLA